jgi:rubrerythrin
MTADTPRDPAAPLAPESLDDFMAQALAMEMEAQQRYGDLADMMEMHNNREVAELFRKMSVIEGKHAAQIKAEMGWTETPRAAAIAPVWQGFEAAETIPTESLHYLMQPYHALELALAAEQRAEAFFAHLAGVATTEAVRRAALELQDEEREHVELIRAWMAKVPKPDKNWADDPDPPRYDE